MPDRFAVEVGAALTTRYDRGHDKPWRVCRYDGRAETCWRFPDYDAAWMFSTFLGQHAIWSPPPPEADRYAAKFGGARETADA